MKVIDQVTGLQFELRTTDELNTDLVCHSNKWQCDHSEISIRRMKISGGSLQYRMQCTHCGERVGNAIKKTEAPSDAQDEDVSLLQKFKEDRVKDYENIIQKHVQRQQQKDNSFYEKYNSYLKSPEWALKREKVLKRARSVCEGCGQSQATEVHHLTYQRLFNEMLFDLVAVCKNCHNAIHSEDEVSLEGDI